MLLIEKPFFPPLYVFGSFVENYLFLFMWVYIWTLNFHFIVLCVCSLAKAMLSDYCALHCNLKSGAVIFMASSLSSPQECFGYSGGDLTLDGEHTIQYADDVF